MIISDMCGISVSRINIRKLMAFAEIDLSFDELYAAWQKAKDRKENQTLSRVDFDRDEIVKIGQERPMWSAGVACALRTFDYY